MSPLPEDVIVTSSQNNASKARTAIKTAIYKAKRKELNIIPLKEGESIEKREIEIIRKITFLIPGSILLNKDFLYCLRNYLGYKCALTRETCIDEVVEYFKNEFERDINWSIKILELDKAEHYMNTVAFKNPEFRKKRKSILNEIFLPIVSCIYQYQIECLDVSAKPFEIKEKRSIIMEMLYGLYIGKVFIGYIITNELRTHRKELLNDVKLENRWGYLLLTDMKHIQEFQGVGFFLCNILNHYWDENNYECIFPIGENISDINFVEGVFIYNRKIKEAFQEKQKYQRLKGEQRFRKKEGY